MNPLVIIAAAKKIKGMMGKDEEEKPTPVEPKDLSEMEKKFSGDKEE
tara:strand:- start:763 stop:903 length:141 start_codon:yes stop_codon:yes gene_type:complete